MRNWWNRVGSLAVVLLLVMICFTAVELVNDSSSEQMEKGIIPSNPKTYTESEMEIGGGTIEAGRGCGPSNDAPSNVQFVDHLDMPNYGWESDVRENLLVTGDVQFFSGDSLEYSGTNNQVAGVDEPDIVKTDGEYLYVVSDNSVIILKAYPASSAAVLSRIKADLYWVDGIFVSDPWLVVFGHYNGTNVSIFDITDKTEPELVQRIHFSGYYFNSRMIGDYVYIVLQNHNYYFDYEKQISQFAPPMISINDVTRNVDPTEICFCGPEEWYSMVTIVSIDIPDKVLKYHVQIMGYSNDMYVSRNNIYIVGSGYSDGEHGTVINKISINEGEIEYMGDGWVPGYILNQFSMDEYKGYFRIATTHWMSGSNVYVLNSSLEVVGKIEGIAPNENMHSARFMATRCFLVTFEKIDPFFVIGLEDPTSPEILGELKIPGFSDYLHPYDVNHIIGVGKDAYDMGDFSWFQGVKLSLFDVTDLSNPKEISNYIIGDRGTESIALREHRAFLFSKSENLLVIPIELREVKDPGSPPETYGEFTFQGVYVFSVTPEDGFELRGRITHFEEGEEVSQCDYYMPMIITWGPWMGPWVGPWGNWGIRDVGFNDNYEPPRCPFIVRSLYIENALYTISDEMVKINHLDSLDEIKSIDL